MNMKKIFIGTALALATLTLTGCGQRVEVPPSYEGKVLTPNGYKPDTIPPSIFRLDACFWPGAICDKLVLIEKTDNGVKEEFRLFMPVDQLNIGFDLRMTASIRDGATDAILNRMTAIQTDTGAGTFGSNRLIDFQRVYNTYAQPIIREVVRNVMAEFSINQVLSSREQVNAELREKLENSLKHTPIILKTVGLADVQWPEIITQQKELAKQREVEIEQQEAIRQKRLIELDTDLQAAKAERAIRRERAEAAAEENEIAAKSVTPEYLEYKKLEVLSDLASNGNTVYVPFGALDTVGMSVKQFGN